jgi:hypothetical protein
MPVQGFASQLRQKYPGFATGGTLGHINTTSFLFGDDEENPTGSAEQSGLASSDIKSYLQPTATDDKFPTLVRRDDNSGLVSVSPGARSLANPAAAFRQLGCTRPGKLSIAGPGRED